VEQVKPIRELLSNLMTGIGAATSLFRRPFEGRKAWSIVMTIRHLGWRSRNRGGRQELVKRGGRCEICFRLLHGGTKQYTRGRLRSFSITLRRTYKSRSSIARTHPAGEDPIDEEARSKVNGVVNAIAGTSGTLITEWFTGEDCASRAGHEPKQARAPRKFSPSECPCGLAEAPHGAPGREFARGSNQPV
jgi:hypothetical protein